MDQDENRESGIDNLAVTHELDTANSFHEIDDDTARNNNNVDNTIDNELNNNRKNNVPPTTENEINNIKNKLVANIKHTSTDLGFSLKGEKIKNPPLLKDSKTVQKFSPLSKQSMAATGSIMATIAAGLTTGYSAILIPQLEEENGPIAGDTATTSWIASMAALPMALGCLLSGWMMERWGRKASHLILCVPFVLGWVLISCASNLAMMLAGRFFTGLCVGLLGPLGPVYIAETSDPKYRGFFLAGVSLAIAVGILIAHILGTFLHWKLTALICSVCPLICYLILSFVPESPTWLISKGRKEDGIKAFNWLRGYDDAALDELKGILEKQDVVETAPELTLKDKFTAITKPEVYKPLIIMIIFFLTCQFSGVNAVAFYSVTIMQKTLGSGMDKYVAMIIVDLVRVLMSLAACILCRRYGRRPLAMFSGSITAISLFGLSTFLILTREMENVNSLSWIPLSLLVTYICAISVGIVPLPWIMCGEVFPTQARGLGSGVSSAVAFAAFFAVVKTAPAMLDILGDAGRYIAYGTVAAVGTAVMFFILPETKGKSLQEIENKFKGTKPKTVV